MHKSVNVYLESLEECGTVNVVCGPPPFPPFFSATIRLLGLGDFHTLYQHSFSHSIHSE